MIRLVFVVCVVAMAQMVCGGTLSPLPLGQPTCTICQTGRCPERVTSYFNSSVAPPYNLTNPSKPLRQLLAMPYQFSGGAYDLFEVTGVSFYSSSTVSTLNNVLVMVWLANETNPNAPGAPVNEPFQAMTVTKTASNVGQSLLTLYSGDVGSSFNLSVGTYYVSVALWGSGGSLPSSNLVVDKNATSALYAVYPGIPAADGFGANPPCTNTVPTTTWILLSGTDSSTYSGHFCVWLSGTTHHLSGPSTSTTTGGGSTTTGDSGGSTTTGGSGGSTTTGGSGGGDSNPTDFLVQYPLLDDLNDFSPYSFITNMASALNLDLYTSSQLYLSSVKRAQVQQAKRAGTTTGSLVDFYLSGSDGPALMNTALSFSVQELRNYSINIASSPVSVSASSAAALTSLMRLVLRLLR